MAKYISIPTSTASIPSITFNTDLITSVAYKTATTLSIWAFGKEYIFTTSAGGAQGTITSINNAILSVSGPLLVRVAMPTGVTIANPPVIA